MNNFRIIIFFLIIITFGRIGFINGSLDKKRNPFDSPKKNKKYIFLKDKKKYEVNKNHTYTLKHTLIIKILPTEEKFRFIPVSLRPENTTINKIKLLKRKNIKYFSYNLKSSKENEFFKYSFKNNKIYFEVNKTKEPFIIFFQYTKKGTNKLFSLSENFSLQKNIFIKEISLQIPENIDIKVDSHDKLKTIKRKSYNFTTYTWRFNYLYSSFKEDLDLNIILYNNLEDLNSIIKTLFKKTYNNSDYLTNKSQTTKNIINYFISKRYTSTNLYKLNDQNTLLNNPSYTSIFLSNLLKKKGLNCYPVILFKNKSNLNSFKKFPQLSKNLNYGIIITDKKKYKIYELGSKNSNYKYAFKFFEKKLQIKKIYKNHNLNLVLEIKYQLKIINKHVTLVEISLAKPNLRKINNLLTHNKYFHSTLYNKKKNNIKVATGYFIKQMENYLLFDLKDFVKKLDSIVFNQFNNFSFNQIERKLVIQKPKNFEFIIYPKNKAGKNWDRIIKKENNTIYIQEYINRTDKQIPFTYKNEILLLKKENNFFYNIF